MHAYATNASDRNNVPRVIAVLAVIASLLLTYVPKIPWWVDAPSIMGFFSGLYWLFNKYLWKLNIKGMRLSSVPDIRGSWKGHLSSNYAGGTEKRAVLYIRQTWTDIFIELETDTSRSGSTMAALNTSDSQEGGLKYEFKNEPTPSALDTMQPIRGTAHLRLTPNGRRLEGEYYTGRGRGTVGKMSFEFVSRDILDSEELITSNH